MDQFGQQNHLTNSVLIEEIFFEIASFPTYNFSTTTTLKTDLLLGIPQMENAFKKFGGRRTSTLFQHGAFDGANVHGFRPCNVV